MLADTALDGCDQVGLDEIVEELSGQIADVHEVAVIVQALLLSAKQLNENLRFASRELIEWVSVPR